MRLRDSTLLLTPTDIANHLACRHLTQLDRARLAGQRIEFRQDPRIEALRHRGDTHEKRFVESLATQGLSVVDLRDAHDAAATLDAMQARTDAIVQAPLEHDGISGRADVLLRVDRPSRLGAYSYRNSGGGIGPRTRSVSPASSVSRSSATSFAGPRRTTCATVSTNCVRGSAE